MVAGVCSQSSHRTVVCTPSSPHLLFHRGMGAERLTLSESLGLPCRLTACRRATCESACSGNPCRTPSWTPPRKQNRWKPRELSAWLDPTFPPLPYEDCDAFSLVFSLPSWWVSSFSSRPPSLFRDPSSPLPWAVSCLSLHRYSPCVDEVVRLLFRLPFCSHLVSILGLLAGDIPSKSRFRVLTVEGTLCEKIGKKSTPVVASILIRAATGP